MGPYGFYCVLTGPYRSRFMIGLELKILLFMKIMQ